MADEELNEHLLADRLHWRRSCKAAEAERDAARADLEALAVAAAEYRDALDGVFEAEQAAGPQEASLWNALDRPGVKAAIKRARSKR